MSFKINISEDISIAELIKINNDGGVVLKTPHVGNIYPNNLAIASLGIPTLFYDRTLGRKDLNFHPNKLIVGGKSLTIADPEILTTHARITNLPEGVANKFKVGTSLSDFHMSALKLALPQSNCFTYTDYLKNNKDEVIQILEEVTNLHPQPWSRVVNEEGKTFKLKAENWDEIIKIGIYGLTNLKSGWIIPNPINILFHGTIDALKSGVRDIYLLSGPDMYRYVDEYQEELDEIYNHLRDILNWNLPETVSCNIIPVIGMRFIVEVGYKEALDKLLDLYIKYISLEEEIDSSIKSGDDDIDTEDLIKEKMGVKEEIFSCLSESFEAFRTTMFYDIEKANCFTQYDLISSNGLYIHPWAINSKLSEVSKAFNVLSKYYSLVRDQLQEEL